MTPRKAPEAVLVALAETAESWMGCTITTGPRGDKFYAAVLAYRAAVAPLRTRAEVDAEIAALCRECIADAWQDLCMAKWDAVTRLCSEPTADETEAVGDRKRVAGYVTGWLRNELGASEALGYIMVELQRRGDLPPSSETEPNATTDHDADLRDPEPCSCEEAEALRELLRRVYKNSLYYQEGRAIKALSLVRHMCKEYSD